MAKYHPWLLQVGDLPGKWDRREIIPDPEWQRGYIWKLKDEQLLIDSILKGIPIPKFYLTQDFDSRKKANVHNVIDGQQRLRAIYRFLTNKFTVTIDKKEYSFGDLDEGKVKTITSYELHGHTLTDYTFTDVTLLFERLNRTGILLTNMEAWHGKYARTNILKMITDISEEHKKYYQDIIYTEENVHRFLQLDDILDICHSISHDGVAGGSKKDLEDFLEQNKDISDSDANRFKNRFRKVVNILKEILPKEELQAILFAKRTHFFSLFISILFTSSEYYLLGHTSELKADLVKFINDQPQEYKDCVVGAIRSKDKRVRRMRLLTEVLKKHAIVLDKKRAFDPSLKSKLWSVPSGHECQICHKPIHNFGDATIDHIMPWAKGGKTEENNAQIAHKVCNRKKRDEFEKYILE
jgi:5-methylcytosine-specific restriction endonuclease McrA